MHWRNKTRDWPDADGDRISWRLVEGLEDLLTSIEDRGGGQIDYVRLRRPPTGNAAKRAKGRYVGWDNLDDCRDQGGREIAAEITAAALHLCEREKCGQAFEVQATYTVDGQSGQSKSISFNLNDGSIEDDEDSEAYEKQNENTSGVGLGLGLGLGLSPERMLEMLTVNPMGLVLWLVADFNRTLIAHHESARRVEQSRFDRLLHAHLEDNRRETTVIDRFVKMLDPVLVHAGNMTNLGFQALTSQAEVIREGKEAEAELELKKARLQTIADGFGGLKELASGLGLELIARKMGVDPTELRNAAAAAQQATKTPTVQTPASTSTPTSTPTPTQTETDQAICAKGRELRASLTNEQLDAIEQIHESIAKKLRALHQDSTAEDFRAAFGEIKDVLLKNVIVMKSISDKMDGPQQYAVLQLLNLMGE